MAKSKRSYGFLSDLVSALYAREDRRIEALEAKKGHLSKEAFNHQLQKLVAEGRLTQAEIDAFIHPVKGLGYQKALLMSQLQNQASAL